MQIYIDINLSISISIFIFVSRVNPILTAICAVLSVRLVVRLPAGRQLTNRQRLGLRPDGAARHSLCVGRLVRQPLASAPLLLLGHGFVGNR